MADLTALAVYRYYYLNHSTENNHVLSLHWNKDALVITAFNEHKAVFSRYLKYAERLGQPIDENGMNDEKAKEIVSDLMIEINRILDFYQFSITKGESAINLLLLSGDFNYMEIVQERLNQSIDIPIHDYKDDKEPLELGIKFVDALGLALKKED